MGGHRDGVHLGVRAYRKSPSMSHWLCLPPATSPPAPSPPFSTESFVVVIRHGKGRRHEITVGQVASTVRVTGPEGRNSGHLWLWTKEKMLHSQITHVAVQPWLNFFFCLRFITSLKKKTFENGVYYIQVDNSLSLSLTWTALSTTGLVQAVPSHCLYRERESPSGAELMDPRGEFSAGMGDALPKNKV